MNIHLFVPCFMDQFYPDAVWHCVRLLENENCKIDFLESAICCGQPAFNSGYHEDAKLIAEKIVNQFSKLHSPIVVLSGSCCSMMKLHYGELAMDEQVISKWNVIKTRLYEFSDFWVNQLGSPSSNFQNKKKVLFHRSCHSLRELKVSEYTERMLNSVDRLEIITTEDFDACCGFGGTFSVKFPEISVSMANAKLDYAIRQNVDGITSSDMSCLMHLKARADLRKLKLNFWYAPELLVHE